MRVQGFDLHGSIIHIFIEEDISEEKKQKEIGKDEKEKGVINHHDDYHILTE